MTDTLQALVEAAAAAREKAYAPYSGYAVGAALRSTDGRVFTGVNVENASYPAGICAERAALAAAVTAGARQLEAIALYAAGRATPCGICRQALAEFGDMTVICAGPDTPPRVFRLSALLPEAFTL